ncbi:MAG: GGDEF domain-containing protein [Gammaproteobacteria bacterium]|nr:GGDEF domain-containing protein [Gammaproteobacteria bacterium]
MSTAFANDDLKIIRLLTKSYARLLLIGFSLVPFFVIAYLYLFQNQSLKFEHHRFHELAIGVSILIGSFVSYITWRCYRFSGEPFLRWLTVGFLGFTLVYAPHGAFTSYAHENIWLFILYGPASRLVMAVCFFVGLLQYGKPAEAEVQRRRKIFWWSWIFGFLLIDIAVAALANSSIAGNPAVRLTMEISALCVTLIAIVIMAWRQIRSPLMVIYAIALACFAQSSLAFVLSLPWNHMWWLAHAIFAGGFFFLSYGIAQAFNTTRSFSTVYSQVELMEQLQRANQNLEKLVATDSLTGAVNRRELMSKAEVELAGATRLQTPLSVLALDLDHFKSVNDRYGHQAGDEVLKAFVKEVTAILRPSDIVGRVGGEEFLVLLPDTHRAAAEIAAERIRRGIEALVISASGNSLPITVSIGVAQFGVDGDTADACFAVADARLYRAKQDGRNRVVSQ